MQASKTSDIQVVFVHASTNSWAIVPEVKERILNFCNNYESDADPATLLRAFDLSFVSESPSIIVFVAIDGQQHIVAHAVFNIEDFFGKKSLNVMQLEIDRPIDRAIIRGVLGSIEQWALSRGISNIRCIALDERRARAFRRMYGMFGERVVLTRSICRG